MSTFIHRHVRIYVVLYEYEMQQRSEAAIKWGMTPHTFFLKSVSSEGKAAVRLPMGR